MKSAMKPIVYTSSILLFVGVLIWGIALQYAPSHTSVWNYAYNIAYAVLYGIGAIVGLTGAWYVTTQISMGQALLFLGLAQLSYVGGLLVWSYYNLIAKVTVPYPSLADLLFGLFYPLLAIGCWHFLTMVATHIKTQYLFEVLGIFFVSTILILSFLTSPDTSGSTSLITESSIFGIPWEIVCLLPFPIWYSGRGARNFKPASLSLSWPSLCRYPQIRYFLSERMPISTGMAIFRTFYLPSVGLF
jgi:hypothetical protein